jgi:outer membrane immunogenic protein
MIARDFRGLNRMKKFVLGALALVAFAAPAIAADMPTKAPIIKAPMSAWSWTGFYAGVNAGYGSTHSYIFEDCQDCVPNPILPQGTFDAKGFIGGAQLGYNYQVNSLVLGVEGDFDYFGAKASGLGLNNGYINTVHYHWFATARGRLGWAIDKALVYVTGGGAFANISHSSLNPEGADATTTRTGWIVGGGLEYAFAPHWTVKGEYLYADLGTTVLHGTFSPPRPIYFDYQDKVKIFRVGVNYLFNGP